jgi:hypothetical protein
LCGISRQKNQPGRAKAASSARNSGMPWPVSLLVTSTMGWAAVWRRASASTSEALVELRGRHIIGLGQHDLKRDRGFIQ